MRVYVGNIAFEASEAEVREMFDPFGSIVDFYYAMDKETGRPRGFAFVTYKDRNSGEEAIRAMDGFEVEGRCLKVNEGEQRKDRPSGWSNNTGGGGKKGAHRGGGRERSARRH